MITKVLTFGFIPILLYKAQGIEQGSDIDNLAKENVSR